MKTLKTFIIVVVMGILAMPLFASTVYKSNFSGGMGADLASFDDDLYLLIARPDTTLKFGKIDIIGTTLTLKSSTMMPDRTTSAPTLVKIKDYTYIIFADDQHKPRVVAYKDSGSSNKYLFSKPNSQVCVESPSAALLGKVLFITWTNPEKFIVLRGYRIAADGSIDMVIEKTFDDYLSSKGVGIAAAGDYLFFTFVDETKRVNIAVVEVKGIDGGQITLHPLNEMRLENSRTVLDSTIQAETERNVVVAWVDEKEEIIRLKWTGISKSYLDSGVEERYNDKSDSPVGLAFLKEKLWMTYVDQNEEVQVVKYE
jgi:hypothetical protein